MLGLGSTTQRREGQSNLKSLIRIASDYKFESIDIAAAYVTAGGARDLITGLSTAFGAAWPGIQKRWIVAFDYCRSEPIALRMLRDLDNSAVRVPEGRKVISQSGMPKVPFHPKAFLFRGPSAEIVFAGSGNISRSGLNTGHEVALHVGRSGKAHPNDARAAEVVTNLTDWFEDSWGDAQLLTPALLVAYTGLFESIPLKKSPTPTEDDVSDEASSNRSMTPLQLRKLRTCLNFWVEAGNVSRNLGNDTPGNQIMLKRLSRVFFGVPAANVPHNSPLKHLTVMHGEHIKPDCSLTFSDNGMDKITLPIPGFGGPASYDQKTLLFTRIGPSSFKLTVGSLGQINLWRNKSAEIDAAYKMSSGREWGVF